MGDVKQGRGQGRDVNLALQDLSEVAPSHPTRHAIGVNARAPVSQLMANEIDVALAHVDDRDWNILSDCKNKTVIDLDNWREPNWDNIGYYVAAGYPNEHKELVMHTDGMMVATKLITAIAKMDVVPSPTRPEFTLHGHLGELQGYAFSGMSGGPVYAVEGDEQREVEDEELFPVGIAFEGYPSTNKPDKGSQEDNATTILSQGDFCIRAHTLTPKTFEEWLRGTDLA